MDSFNKVELYKNFNMGTEIDIAGIFIYDGIKELERIVSFSYESEIFSFLYHISVGIERLQKVLLVMLEERTEDCFRDFEDSLRTHNHIQLHDRIKKECNITLSPREYSFLNVLSSFYMHYRYDRFMLNGSYDADKELLCNFIKAHFSSDNIKRNFFTDDVINTLYTKEFFGRIIGAITRKYYSEIKSQAHKQNLYTYEIRNGSPAEKIFLTNNKKDSLHVQNINEQVAVKELIIYLINTQDINAFMRFIRQIEPLDFDIALVNEYIEEICNAHISQNLVDETEALYEDLQSARDRLEIINLVGNANVDFEYSEIMKCYYLMKSLINGECECIEFAKIFPDEFYLLEPEIQDVLKKLPELCTNLLNIINLDGREKEQFIEVVSSLLKELKEYCCIKD